MDKAVGELIHSRKQVLNMVLFNVGNKQVYSNYLPPIKAKKFTPNNTVNRINLAQLFK